MLKSSCTSWTEKWIIAILAGLFFVIFSSQFLYSATNQLSCCVGWPPTYQGLGGPTIFGYLVHLILLVILFRLLLG